MGQCVTLRSLPTQEPKPNSRIREQPGWRWCVWLPEARLTHFTSADLLWLGGSPLWFRLLCSVSGSWLGPGLSPGSFYPDGVVKRGRWPPLHGGRTFSPSSTPAPSPPPSSPPPSPPSSAAQDLLPAAAGHHCSRLGEAQLQGGGPGGSVHPVPCPVWAEGSGHMAAEGIPVHPHPAGQSLLPA